MAGTGAVAEQRLVSDSSEGWKGRTKVGGSHLARGGREKAEEQKEVRNSPVGSHSHAGTLAHGWWERSQTSAALEGLVDPGG